MANYDTLTIKIVANTQVALNNIEKLESHLSKLEKQASEMDLGHLKNVQTILQDIANIDFSKVAAGLYNITKSFEAFNDKTFMSNFSMAKEESEDFTESVEKALEPMEELDNATLSVDGKTEQLDKSVKVLTDDLENMGIKGSTSLQKLAKKFKSLALYRMMRLVLMEIQKAFSQGIQELAKVDEDFNKAISNIRSGFQNVARGIIVAIAPILEALAPVIKLLSDVLVDVLNLLARILGTLLGTGFSQATKNVEDFAKSLKKVKSATLGIDELNIISKDAESENEYFIKVEVDGLDKLDETTEKIKALGIAIGSIALLMAVDWKKAIATISTKLLGLGKNISLTKTQILGIVATVGGILTTISGILDMLNNGFDWDNMITVLEGISLSLIGLGLALKSLNLGIIGGFVAGMILFVSLYKKISDSWGNMSVWQKIAAGIGLVLVAIGTLAAVITAFTHQWHIFAIAVAGVALGAGLSAISTRRTSNVEAPSFATGGFPQEDGFFYANHSELVGSFSDGRTVVANNEQIVEGIKQGVYEAVSMANSGRGEHDTNVVVYLDSREIAKRVEERTSARKDNGVLGGFKYGGI